MEFLTDRISSGAFNLLSALFRSLLLFLSEVTMAEMEPAELISN